MPQGRTVICLFTDFGYAGPYMGQMHLVLNGHAPAVPAVDLMADAPACNPRAAAYLLAALGNYLPPRAVVLAVVDPGVGGERTGLAADIDGRWFVGPDNGLFELLLRRGSRAALYVIDEAKFAASATFHGRDIFAPVAARLALSYDDGTLAGLEDILVSVKTSDRHDAGAWPDDLGEIVYIDHYGNALTGLRAAMCADGAPAKLADGTVVRRGRRFGDAGEGEALCYENSIGLIEIAVNRGRADERLGLKPGDRVDIERARQ